MGNIAASKNAKNRYIMNPIFNFLSFAANTRYGFIAEKIYYVHHLHGCVQYILFSGKSFFYQPLNASILENLLFDSQSTIEKF